MQAYPSFQPLARCLFRQKLFIQTKTRKSIHLPSFPTVLLRRTLFLRKHHPMDYPPFCLALRSLSSSLLYWLYCDVRFRSCCTSCAFSRYRFNSHWKHSFRNLPLTLFIYYLISAMIRKRTVPSLFPSCTFPVSESDYVGFLFVRRTQWTVTWSFKISDAVIHHFSLCTQLRKIFNCNCSKCDLTVSGGVCTFLSSSCSIFRMSADRSEKYENQPAAQAACNWICRTALWNSSPLTGPLRLIINPNLVSADIFKLK